MSSLAVLDDQPESVGESRLAELVARAGSLYTLPAVAAEVIELTADPKVDARALKECLQRDPALTAKILRVVNSSLFGLSRQVTDLNQALALLGTKPLKVLVLGFSLPEKLLGGVPRQQLHWYWTQALTRAVAAREISETWFHLPGDEAFLAGLLEDLGILVLVKEIGAPYVALLDQVDKLQLDLCAGEAASLGFDHLELSARLLELWRMPTRLVEAIEILRKEEELKSHTRSAAELARILHLANLLGLLVSGGHLSVLPKLLQAGADYCQLDRAQLNKLVANLQPKVEQLAEVLALDWNDPDNYLTVLAQAHQQMTELAESMVLRGTKSAADLSELPEDLLRITTELQVALQQADLSPSVADESSQSLPPRIESTARLPVDATNQGSSDTDRYRPFQEQLVLAVGACRSRRQPLSVIFVEATPGPGMEGQDRETLRQLLDRSGRETPQATIMERSQPLRRCLVLPACDRQQAVRAAHELSARIAEALSRMSSDSRPLEARISAGVASVGLPPRNFEPHRLLETAERCLAAALISETSAVKSLEIY